MDQPKVVITVNGGIAEVHHNELEPIDVLIIDFDFLNEQGTREEKEKADALIESGDFNAASEYLANLEDS